MKRPRLEVKQFADGYSPVLEDQGSVVVFGRPYPTWSEAELRRLELEGLLVGVSIQ